MPDKIDGPLMVHAINAAEGVLASGQDGPVPALLLVAAQVSATDTERADVHFMATVEPDLQVKLLEEALQLARKRLAEKLQAR